MKRLPIIVPAGSGETLQVLADKVRVLASGEQTGFRYEVFEVSGSKDSGPPPHCHPWDETFLVVDGEIEITVDTERVVARREDFVLAPGGVSHAFRIVSESARFLVLTSGAGAGAFFRAMNREIGYPPPSFEAVRAVASRHGVAAVG